MKRTVEDESNTVWRRYQESVEWFDEQWLYDFDLLGWDGLPLRTLSVKNISKQTKPSDLEKLFSRYGEIKECKVIQNRGRVETYVTFSSTEDALRARIDGARMRMQLHNRILRVSPANAKDQLGCTKSCATVRKVCENSENTSNGGDAKIDILNNDCLTEIFLRLPILDRIRLERVCKRWRAVSQASWSYVRKLALLKSTWGFSYESKFKAIDRKMLRNVLQRCGSHLKEIHLLGNIFETSYSKPLLDAAVLCPNLQIINAARISVSLDCIELLSRNCHDIRSFALGHVDNPCDSALIELFKQTTKLSHFLACWKLHGNCLLHLPRTTIREIVLMNSRPLDFDYLARALREFKNLLTFGIHSGSFDNLDLPVEVMEAVSTHRKQLKRLEVIGFNLAVPRCRVLITELSTLEVLNLQGTDINDDFLIELSGKCKKLTHLNISDCSSITWAGIAALASLPKLGKLLINHWLESVVVGQNWDQYKGLEIQELPHTSDFHSLKHLECQRSYILSPSEICCLIECSPLLELVDLSKFDANADRMIEGLIEHVTARNSKVAFKMHFEKRVGSFEEPGELVMIDDFAYFDTL